MQTIRRVLLSIVAVLGSALPAAAQATASADTAGGPSLLFVWAWILIAGVIIFIVGTSMGINSGRK